MTVVLFGSNNPSGAFFKRNAIGLEIEVWGRRYTSDSDRDFHYCDLKDLESINLMPLNGVIVSFAPIWLLAPFIENALKRNSELHKNLVGIIACSSSSYITKQYAFNKKDQQLANRLRQAHTILSKTCESIGICCQILAPTLVYGSCDGYTDKNISVLIRIMRALPMIGLPSCCGLRQPIHASQLASAAECKAMKMLSGTWNNTEPLVVSLGGDESLSYKEMLLGIQRNLPTGDAARRCRIIEIPNFLYNSLTAAVLPIDATKFEALMRINSNLSGFCQVHTIIGGKPQNFPILPLPL